MTPGTKRLVVAVYVTSAVVLALSCALPVAVEPGDGVRRMKRPRHRAR